MLQDFFECAPCADPAARSRFERLSIWEADGGRWREHQGRYPVVMLSLKEAASLTWEQTLGQMAALMARECDRHAYVLESPDLGPGDRAWFERVRLGEGSYADLAGFLRQLSRILHEYHGEHCMVIVDEYDQPITRAHARGYYDEAVEFMRNWLSGGLKTNPSLAYGVLTGVQRISKESIWAQQHRGEHGAQPGLRRALWLHPRRGGRLGRVSRACRQARRPARMVRRLPLWRGRHLQPLVGALVLCQGLRVPALLAQHLQQHRSRRGPARQRPLRAQRPALPA